jgi:hypothetical protein
MLTGELKSQVGTLWNSFWTGGIANPLKVVEQITYLLFIKRLDELQALEENKSARLGESHSSTHTIFYPRKFTRDSMLLNLRQICSALLFVLLAIPTISSNAQTLKEQYEHLSRQKQTAEQQRLSDLEKHNQLMREAYRSGLWLDCDGLVRVFHRGIVWWASRDRTGSYESTLDLPNRYFVKKGIVSWNDSLEKISLELHLDSLEWFSSISVRMGLGPTKCKVVKGHFGVL